MYLIDRLLSFIYKVCGGNRQKDDKKQAAIMCSCCHHVGESQREKVHSENSWVLERI